MVVLVACKKSAGLTALSEWAVCILGPAKLAFKTELNLRLTAEQDRPPFGTSRRAF